MNWQTFLDELKREYDELGAENPPIDNEDGVISIDVEKVVI